MAAELVLVVEDNPMNVQLVRAVLCRSGYRVAVARSLREARLFLGSERPDLVLLDIGLPDGDGLELMDVLRERGIPALAVSAFAMAEDRRRAFAAGCAGYLTKPLNTRAFASQVAHALAVREGPEGGGGADASRPPRGR